MNRSLALALSLPLIAVAVWLTWAPLRDAVGVEPLPPAATENGDVNADGDINIADPVYLLEYLFSGGDAPVSIAIAPPRLPATGQEECFNCSGDVISCDSTSYPGQDAVYQAGCPAADRFVDLGDGTIIDNCTGLQWEKAAADSEGDGEAETMRWCAGLRYCEELELAEHDDWRMPNARELQSLIDYASENGTFPAGFEGPEGPYWSSTTRRTDILQAWAVDFSEVGGIAARTKLVELSHARAVRDAGL